MVLHALLVSTQASIDIANHLIAASGSRRPETYRESFAILSELGVIPGDPVARLSDLAGFRNVLVHPHCHLDENYGVLREDFQVVKRPGRGDAPGAPLPRAMSVGYPGGRRMTYPPLALETTPEASQGLCDGEWGG